jgi:hypothetical protein
MYPRSTHRSHQETFGLGPTSDLLPTRRCCQGRGRTEPRAAPRSAGAARSVRPPGCVPIQCRCSSRAGQWEIARVPGCWMARSAGKYRDRLGTRANHRCTYPSAPSGLQPSLRSALRNWRPARCSRCPLTAPAQQRAAPVPAISGVSFCSIASRLQHRLNCR